MATIAAHSEPQRRVRVYRRATVVREHIRRNDDGTLSARLRWTTGATVTRHPFFSEPYDESLDVTAAAVRMARLESGAAPLLNSHRAWDLRDQIGVVDAAEIDDEAGEGWADVRFSPRDELADLVRDVELGIVANVSVGYDVHRYETIEPEDRDDGGKLRLKVARDWEPLELSLVTIGADAGAGVRARDEAGNPAGFAGFPSTYGRELEAEPAGSATMNEEPAGEPVEEPTAESTSSDTEGAETMADRSGTQTGAAAPATEPTGSSRPSSDDELDGLSAVERANRAATDRVLTIQAAAKRLAQGDPSIARELGELADRLVRAPNVQTGDALERLHRRAVELDEADGVSGTLRVEAGDQDATTSRLAGMKEIILHRFDPKAYPVTELGRQYYGCSLLEMAHEDLTARGVRWRGKSRTAQAGMILQPRAPEWAGGLRHEVAAGVLTLTREAINNAEPAATRDAIGLHTIADFPLLLADVSHIALRRGYEELGPTWRPFVAEAVAEDFKARHSVIIGHFPTLEELNEHGEYTYGTVGEGSESYAVRSFGRILGVTRKVIVNDGLGGIMQAFRKAGQAGGDRENRIVYALITGNPVLSDGSNVYDATLGTHIASGGTVNKTQISAMRLLMRKRTGVDSGDPEDDERKIRARLAWLALPAEKETDAEDFFSDKVVPATASNAVSDRMRTSIDGWIPEPLLDDTSTDQWYGFADPAVLPALEAAYLEGERGVVTETRTGFNVDGLEIRARMDIGAGWIDRKGTIRNSGVTP